MGARQTPALGERCKIRSKTREGFGIDFRGSLGLDPCSELWEAFCPKFLQPFLEFRKLGNISWQLALGLQGIGTQSLLNALRRFSTNIGVFFELEANNEC